MFSAATRRRLALRRLHRQQKRILCVAVLLQQLDQLNGAQQEETVQCECECRLCSVGHRKGSCSSAGWATEQPGIPEDSAVASAVDSGSADDEEIEADEADDLVRSLVNRQRRRTLFTFELLQTLR